MVCESPPVEAAWPAYGLQPRILRLRRNVAELEERLTSLELSVQTDGLLTLHWTTAQDNGDFSTGKLQAIASAPNGKNSILDELEKQATDLLDDFTQVTKSYNNLSPKKMITSEVSPAKEATSKISPKKKKSTSAQRSSEDESQVNGTKSSKSDKKLNKQKEKTFSNSKQNTVAQIATQKDSKSKGKEAGDSKNISGTQIDKPSEPIEKISTHSKNKKLSNDKSSTSSEENRSPKKNRKKNQASDLGKPSGPSQKTERKQKEPKKKDSKATLEELPGGKLLTSKARVTREERKKMKAQTPPLVFRLDCNRPATDGILDVPDFVQFLCERFKVNGRVQNLGDTVSIAAYDNCVAISSHDYHYSKRYLKYLTKKYLKKRGLRDWLRVVAPGGAHGSASYELRYYSVFCQHNDDTDDDSD